MDIVPVRARLPRQLGTTWYSESGLRGRVGHWGGGCHVDDAATGACEAALVEVPMFGDRQYNDTTPLRFVAQKRFAGDAEWYCFDRPR